MEVSDVHLSEPYDVILFTPSGTVTVVRLVQPVNQSVLNDSILLVRKVTEDKLVQQEYLQPIITQYFIDNKSEIWLLFLIAHSKR